MKQEKIFLASAHDYQQRGGMCVCIKEAGLTIRANALTVPAKGSV